VHAIGIFLATSENFSGIGPSPQQIEYDSTPKIIFDGLENVFEFIYPVTTGSHSLSRLMVEINADFMFKDEFAQRCLIHGINGAQGRLLDANMLKKS
jgi:hypothetical protein